MLLFALSVISSHLLVNLVDCSCLHSSEVHPQTGWATTTVQPSNMVLSLAPVSLGDIARDAAAGPALLGGVFGNQRHSNACHPGLAEQGRGRVGSNLDTTPVARVAKRRRDDHLDPGHWQTDCQGHAHTHVDDGQTELGTSTGSCPAKTSIAACHGPWYDHSCSGGQDRQDLGAGPLGRLGSRLPISTDWWRRQDISRPRTPGHREHHRPGTAWTWGQQDLHTGPPGWNCLLQGLSKPTESPTRWPNVTAVSRSWPWPGNSWSQHQKSHGSPAVCSPSSMCYRASGGASSFANRDQSRLSTPSSTGWSDWCGAGPGKRTIGVMEAGTRNAQWTHFLRVHNASQNAWLESPRSRWRKSRLQPRQSQRPKARARATPSPVRAAGCHPTPGLLDDGCGNPMTSPRKHRDHGKVTPSMRRNRHGRKMLGARTGSPHPNRDSTGSRSRWPLWHPTTRAIHRPKSHPRPAQVRCFKNWMRKWSC